VQENSLKNQQLGLSKRTNDQITGQGMEFAKPTENMRCRQLAHKRFIGNTDLKRLLQKRLALFSGRFGEYSYC